MAQSNAGSRAPTNVTADLLIAGAVVAVAVVLLAPLPLAVRATTSAVALVVLGIALAHGCLRDALRSTGARRRAWWLFTFAAVTALCGNGWSAVVGADPVSDPSLVAECLVALGQVLSIAAMITLRASGARGPAKALLLLDGFVAGSAALLITTVAVYSRVLDTLQGAWPHQLLTLAFPFLDVVIVTLAALLLAEDRSQRVLLSLIGGGFGLYALGDLGFAVRTAQGSSEFGSPFDLGWIAGYGLLLAATWHPDATREPEAEAGADTLVRRTVLVFGLLLAAVCVELIFPAAGLDPVRRVLWVALVTGVGARQALLTADNGRLRAGLERRVSEQTHDLRQMARANEALLTSVADGIYGVDREGLLTFANPAAAQTLGYRVEDLLGRDPHAVFHAPRSDGTPFATEECYLTQAVDLGMTVSAEADRYTRADGTVIPVEVTASPLQDDDGVRGAVVAFRDMTQRHEVERMKNEFLSVVSHELRTPLTSIRGSLGLLAGGGIVDLNPAAERMVTIALQSSERLSRLINDILDIERIESGRLPMELVPHESGELIDRCLREMAGYAGSAGVALRAGTADGLVLADGDRVLQALTNLVGNAVKFSPSGGVVTVSAAQDPAQPGRSTLFTVTDLGRGIPADKLEAVFHPFEQVDSSDARDHGGTGLGLAITRRIVESHGGRIWATSSPGQGTTMHFTLPSAAPSEPSWPAGDDDAALVLVVEDDTDLATVLSTLLAGNGLRVERVAGVAAAREWLAARRPDVLVLDLDLPDGSGLEVAAALEAQGSAGTSVVVYTGQVVEAEPARRLAAVGATVLGKGSVHPEELEVRVLRLVDAALGPLARGAS